MNFAVCALALFLIMSNFAQQQPQTPSTSPPYTTPPTFPEGQQMPPDKKAPPPRQLTRTEVEQEIKDQLASEPALATAKVNTKVEPQSVELTGTVDTEEQHDLALRIASPTLAIGKSWTRSELSSECKRPKIDSTVASTCRRTIPRIRLRQNSPTHDGTGQDASGAERLEFVE